MPDIWTKHPDIVRNLLKDAGFTCGVEPRFLPGRDPAWTCAFDGKTMRGDLYIHHVDKLRTEWRADDDRLPAGIVPTGADGTDWSLLSLIVALAGVMAARRLRKRARPRSRPASR